MTATKCFLCKCKAIAQQVGAEAGAEGSGKGNWRRSRLEGKGGQVNCWRSCQLWRPIGSNGFLQLLRHAAYSQLAISTDHVSAGELLLRGCHCVARLTAVALWTTYIRTGVGNMAQAQTLPWPLIYGFKATPYKTYMPVIMSKPLLLLLLLLGLLPAPSYCFLLLHTAPYSTLLLPTPSCSTLLHPAPS